MNEKGLLVLEGIKERKYEYLELINFVANFRDYSIENDYDDEIESFCKNYGFEFYKEGYATIVGKILSQL